MRTMYKYCGVKFQGFEAGRHIVFVFPSLYEKTVLKAIADYRVNLAKIRGSNLRDKSQKFLDSWAAQAVRRFLNLLKDKGNGAAVYDVADTHFSLNKIEGAEQVCICLPRGESIPILNKKALYMPSVHALITTYLLQDTLFWYGTHELELLCAFYLWPDFLAPSNAVDFAEYQKDKCIIERIRIG